MSLSRDQVEFVVAAVCFAGGMVIANLLGNLRREMTAQKLPPASTWPAIVPPVARLKPSSLDKYLVPEADDPRWQFRRDEIGVGARLSLGPFTLRVSSICTDDEAFLYIATESDPLTSAGDYRLKDARQWFDEIMTAQGLPLLSRAARAAKAEQELIERALAWHRQDNPPALGPEDTDHLKGPMR